MLAVLLLHAGRVVATDRLIHELWGAHRRHRQRDSLQNAVSQLRKVLGPETLQTRAPGYVLAVENSRIDAGRFESALSDARRAAPAERARLLRQALDMWRGTPLAEFTFASFAQSEIHRLEELRLVATEQRIEADIEGGQPGDVVPELHGLVAEHPLRETYWRLLMLALYRAGRQAEALDAYQSARVRLVDELGIEPSEELRRLHGSILRQDAGLSGPGSVPEADVDAEILTALLAGSVVPVIGLDGAGELAEHLAAAFGVPDDRPIDLARVSQYVTMMQGSGPLYDELHSRFEAAVEPGPLHRFLARLPVLLREQGAPHQLIVTTNYDLGLERAFEEAGEEVDIVSYVASGPHRGRFWHRPPSDEPRPIDVPNTYATELSLERRTILLKLHGAVDPLPEREWESFVITEDDYIDYLGRSELTAVVPVSLAAKLRRSHFLFLGYEMADWNLRLILNRIWGERPVAYRSWAVAELSEPARARLLEALRRRDSRRRPAGVRRAAPAGGSRRLDRRSRSSPYKGLSAFDDSDLDALLFFGRERECEIVVANLIASRLTVLYGPSGVGKSSLLRAAVARRLRELPEAPLVVVFSRWSEDPASALAEAVAGANGDRAASPLAALEHAQAGQRRLPRPRPGGGVLPLPRRRRRPRLVRRGLARSCSPPRCVSTCSSRSARTRSPSSTASRGASRASSRTRSGSTAWTARLRGRRSSGPLDRYGELAGEP